MPPNLGGFFMVRSYYPSECHADYFDFERIEALKPAIEACGISTLSQSPMLDINNTIDHRPEGDEKWFLENEKTVTQFCRKLAAERPLKDIRDEYNYPKKKGIKDECSRLLEASTMKSRRGFAIQRLMNAM